MNQEIRITTLVENTVFRTGLLAEHGLSFWVEYGGKRILFDTGQSEIVIDNANSLGIDLAEADAVVLSHGHYDHTGGLAAVLGIASKAAVYLHPAAIEPKFKRQGNKAKAIGMPSSAREIILRRQPIWTEGPTQIFTGVTVTGQIPRLNSLEDVGEDFFLDADCRKHDGLYDDQALFCQSSNGLAVILGCAHAGVINTLNRIADLSEEKQFYAILGGMHLLNASRERIEGTTAVFREYNLQKIGPVHCTGAEAGEEFRRVFPEQRLKCSVGERIDL